MPSRRLIILGSTGSIGTQALEVVEHVNALHIKGAFPFRYEVVGLAAGRNEKLLEAQAARFNVKNTAIAGDPADYENDVALPPPLEEVPPVPSVMPDPVTQ